jgi:hypothetical protein
LSRIYCSLQRKQLIEPSFVKLVELISKHFSLVSRFIFLCGP